MITVHDAAAIGDVFELGPNPVLTGPVARGEVGQVWKLTSEGAAWAVKEAFEPPHLTEAEHDTCDDQGHHELPEREAELLRCVHGGGL